MGVDKNTVLENAQLFTARGQFEKAVAEWKKLTDGTTADGAIYNTIGDLHLKRNAPADAIDSYFKAAAAFREGEAALKAIALYKKILKVDPTQAEAYRCLGALNAERGLLSNAVSDYLFLTKLYLREGKQQEALEIFRIIATLDPSNLEAQHRIAELAPAGHREAGLQGQAGTDRAAGPPGRAGQEDSPQAVRRDRLASLTSEPAGLRLAQEGDEPVQPAGGPAMSESGGPQGRPRWKPEWSRQDFINEAVRLTADDRHGEAEALLSELLNREPGDPEVCRLLAVLHLRSGQLAAAKAEFRFLAEAAIRAQDFKLAESMLLDCLRVLPDSVLLIELLGRVYEQTGDVLSAAAQYGKAIEVLVEQPDPEQPGLPLELYERIKGLAPSSPLVARFAPVCGSVPVRLEPGATTSAEPPAPPKEWTREAQGAAFGSELPGDRQAPAFKFAEPCQAGERVPQADAQETPVPSSRGAAAFKFAGAHPEPQAGLPSDQPMTSGREAGGAESQALSLGERKPAVKDDATEQAEPGAADHYELGIAYKNMGLRNEAIEEFRLVGKGAARFVDASLMLAACLKEQGLNRPAMASLEEALSGCLGDESKAMLVRYELGLLYEAEGLAEDAGRQFAAIPGFRDASQRLERIAPQGRAAQPGAAEADLAEVPSGPGGTTPEKESRTSERKKRRISYL